MELGLSLGDTTTTTTTTSTSKSSDRLITAAVTATTTTVGVEKSLGFCMALGTNPLDDHDHDDGDGGGDGYDDEQKEKEKGGLKDVISVGSQRISSMNPPVQLDLLPSAPVLRPHTSLPWSSDNGSSEGGGSSGNAAAGRGFEVKRMGAVATEEATSSFRLEFVSYGGRNGMENNNINNKRGGFEIGNDAVVLERASSRASDEDEHGLSRKKLRLSKEQSAYLEESFKEHTTLNPKQKLALAEHLHLRPRQVEVWFQNRRARTKLKQTEVDFEYLKRCCETLTDENRRLHKELQELRALKTTSNPFYMQHPATTLTMCPSCERVATTSAAAPSLSPATLTNPAEQINSKKPRSIVFPVPSNSNHQPAAPS